MIISTFFSNNPGKLLTTMNKTEKTIAEPGRELPVVADVDVVVCGGGPAGVATALAAARSGADVMLLENQICLGGMATAGMVNRLGPYHDQVFCARHDITPREIDTKALRHSLMQQSVVL